MNFESIHNSSNTLTFNVTGITAKLYSLNIKSYLRQSYVCAGTIYQEITERQPQPLTTLAYTLLHRYMI
jgi:hypothetical protein